MDANKRLEVTEVSFEFDMLEESGEACFEEAMARLLMLADGEGALTDDVVAWFVEMREFLFAVQAELVEALPRVPETFFCLDRVSPFYDGVEVFVNEEAALHLYAFLEIKALLVGKAFRLLVETYPVGRIQSSHWFTFAVDTDDLTDDMFRAVFLFDRDEVAELVDRLDLDSTAGDRTKEPAFHCSNGSRPSPTLALLIYLYRMAWPCRFHDMAFFFGMHPSTINEIVLSVERHIYETHARFANVIDPVYHQERLDEYTEALLWAGHLKIPEGGEHIRVLGMVRLAWQLSLGGSRWLA